MGKFCSKCGNEVKNSKSQFCDKCGAPLDEKQNNNATSDTSNSKKMPKWAIILLVIVGIIILVGIISSGSDSSDSGSSGVTDYNGKEPSTTETTTTPKKKVYGYNEMFTFDDLEVTIGDNIVFKTVNNRYSEYNGQTVVGVPFTVKNLKEETHSLNMFYYKIFGSAGTEVKTLNSYFDDTLDYAGDLRYNASYTKYTYFAYDGDGTYSIEFDNWSDKKLVEINVVKK